MNGLPYYKAYPRDFIEGTIGLPFEVKAAYRLVLDLIYMQGGQLPDDPRYIAGLLGCSVRAWKKYRQALLDAGKLNAENGIISNFRADKELETLRTFQRKQAENRRGARKNNGLLEPRSNHTEPEPEPDTTTSTTTAREAEIVAIRGGADMGVDALHKALLDQFQRRGGIPARWVNPAATIRIAQWLDHHGLTPGEILRVAEAQLNHYGKPPGRPEWWDGAMADFAAAKAAPPAEARRSDGPKRQQYGDEIRAALGISEDKR